MRRLLAILVLCVVACAKASLGPVAPPDKLAPSGTPRFEGVYALQKGEAIDLLRFTPAGHVASISTASSAAVETAVRMLLAENERCGKGTYATKDGVLRFALKSKLGTVEYAGAIADDKLVVRWRSSINGVTEEQTYSFVKVVDDEADAGAPRVADDDAVDAGGPAITDASLIPEGTGWFCLKATNGSRCERKQAACESARKLAASVRKDPKVAKCTRQANAYCFTVSQRGGARGAASCSLTAADCDGERASVAAESDPGELLISTCSRQ